MNSYYDTVIVGAGFYECGLAASFPGALMVEESGVVGSDFALAANPGRHLCEPEHPAAQELYGELIRRNAIFDGACHIAALSVELSAWVLNRSLEVRLHASLDCSGGKDDLRLIDHSGVHHLGCRRLLKRGADCSKTKYLNVFLAMNGSESEPGWYGAFELLELSVPDMMLLHLPLAADTSWSMARRILRELWLARPAELAEARVAWSASRFDYGQFENPIQALECGLRQEKYYEEL